LSFGFGSIRKYAPIEHLYVADSRWTTVGWIINAVNAFMREKHNRNIQRVEVVANGQQLSRESAIKYQVDERGNHQILFAEATFNRGNVTLKDYCEGILEVYTS